MLTTALFRNQFPAFDDQACYPGAEVDFWLALAIKLHNADRWGELLDTGLALFVAHNLSIESASKKAAAMGQAPGQITGAVTSVSVDKVSYSRDAGSAMNPKDGHWNLSSYGIRWKALARMVGAGPMQVGVPASYTGGAWPGVTPNPFG